MSVTKRGTLWEITNSLWVLWSFTLFLNFVGFFWIGGRTGQRKWIVSGILYLLADFVGPLIAPELQKVNEIYNLILMPLMFIGWTAAIIQSFLSRREYLLRREAVLDLMRATNDAYRSEIRGEYFGSAGQPAQPPRPPQAMQKPVMPRPAPPVGQPVPPQNLLDLNLAAEQQLAALPGVGVALAKRAVESRAQAGGFASVEDFCARLQLMPHFAEQIRGLAFASPPAPRPKAGDSGGRIVDI